MKTGTKGARHCNEAETRKIAPWKISMVITVSTTLRGHVPDAEATADAFRVTPVADVSSVKTLRKIFPRASLTCPPGWHVSEASQAGEAADGQTQFGLVWHTHRAPMNT